MGYSAESLCTGLARVSFSSSLKLPVKLSLSRIQFFLAVFYSPFLVSLSHQRKRDFVAGMNQKVVLITGCSSGIGLALAVRIAKDEKKRFMGKTSK